MPVQYLYPTGIRTLYSPGDWINQSGHSYSNSNIGIKDINEGIPADNSDWLQSTDPFSSYYYRLWLLSDELLVEPEHIIFRTHYYYSGYNTDSPTLNDINITYRLLDKNNLVIGSDTTYYDVTSVNNWTSLEETSIGNDTPLFDFSRTSILLDIVGFIDVGLGNITAYSSGHLISAIEILVSGDNIRTSGIPLYTSSYYYKNVCLKPESFDGLSNRWTNQYNYSGLFDIGYFRVQDGSGQVIRSDNNSSLSGVYYVTSQGLSDGLLWHNKRLSLNQNPTYEHAPKFNSINDSAILFNSGTLFNRDQFTIMSRFFPSGSTFETNGTGHTTLLNNALHDGTSDYSFKVETSGYTQFNMIMFDSGNVARSTSVTLNATMGFDMLTGYAAGGSGYLYIQNHLGAMSSGIFTITRMKQDHRHKLAIGGILESGV